MAYESGGEVQADRVTKRSQHKNTVKEYHHDTERRSFAMKKAMGMVENLFCAGYLLFALVAGFISAGDRHL